MPWAHWAQAQTAVQAGDVLLLGYRSQDTTDFAFVPLVDLKAGTQLRFTDNGWQSEGGFHKIEGIVTYTAPASGVPSGTIVRYQAQFDDFTHPTQFQLRPEGDQVLVYQGSDDKPAFVCALTYGKIWNGDDSPKDSELPPGLKPGHSALYLPWNNGSYGDKSPGEAVAATLRANLTSTSYWTGLDGQPVAWRIRPLVVLPPLPIHEPVRLPTPPAGADSLLIRLHQVFGSLDVSLVPTGRLNGYGVPFLPLPPFNGALTDSNRTSSAVWRQTYATLVTSRVMGTETLPRLDTLSDRLERMRKAGGAIPIALSRIDYADFRADAVTANLLTAQNGQLYDVPGRTQSPYQVQTLFVAGPARTSSRTGNVSFVFPSSLHVKAGGGALRSLELDFGAGQGYQPAALDQPLALGYCSGTYRVKVRASYYQLGTSGANAPYTAYESHFDFVVEDVTCGAQARYSDKDSLVVFPAELNSGAAHPNFGAKVHIRFGGNHTHLTKPLIVVEGYDSYWAAGSLNTDDDGNYLNYSIDDFMEDITAATDNTPTPSFNFRNSLDDIANYDIVFIDFTNGTDDITHNAEVFKRVLRWVNMNKAKDAAGHALFQNAVVGVSMGGLVARYGLAQMVKTNEDPDTYILATQDSPHRGANTPLGIQALTRQAYIAANYATIATGGLPGILVRAIFPQLDDAVTLLDQPATRQLLLLRAINGASGTETNTFINDVYQPQVTFPATGPQPAYRFVTVSLGSACGTWTLQPSAPLVQMNASGYVGLSILGTGGIRAEAMVKALPHYSGSPQNVSQLRLYTMVRIMPFDIRISTPLLSQSFDAPAHVPCWDGVPGGTRDKGVDIDNGKRWRDFLYFGGGFSAQLAERFCFVPTVSALDLPDINATTIGAQYVNGVASAGHPQAAAFQAAARGVEIHGKPTVRNTTLANFLHPFFRGRQAHWLFEELQRPYNNNTNAAICDPSAECSVRLSAVISGPFSICGSATYSVPVVPGATYSWTASGPAANSFFPTSGTDPTFTTTATAANAGYGSIQVVITPPCGLAASASIQPSICPLFSVRVLKSSLTNQCVSQRDHINNWRNYTANPAGGSGQYTYDWYEATAMGNTPQDEAGFRRAFANYPTSVNHLPTYGTCLNYTVPNSAAKFVGVVVTDIGRGNAKVYHTEVELSMYQRSIYPNPAADYTDVMALDSDGNPDPAPLAPAQVTVYNAQGTSVFESASTMEASVRIATQDWPSGLYHIIVRQKDEEQQQFQLSVEH